MLEDADVLRMIRRRMGLGDTLGALPPECGGTGTTEGFDLGRVYPVGAIYMSAAPTDPGALFGGVWERIEGRFLLAASDAHAAGSTGGESEHMLSVDEMPSHDHDMYQYKHRGTITADYLTSGMSEVVGKASTVGSTGAHSFSVEKMSTSSYAKGYRIVAKEGGDKPHNNMPPYLAVYMWKRTA